MADIMGGVLAAFGAPSALSEAAMTTSPGVLPSWSVLLIFALGAILMRAAGCAINDFADRKVDGSASRSQGAPLG